MADPRLCEVAVRLGHVYYDYASKRGPTSDEYSTSSYSTFSSSEAPFNSLRAQHFEEFRSTMSGPFDPRKFLDALFHEWAPILGKYGEGDVIRTYDAVPPTASYKEFIIEPLVKILNKQTPLLRLRHSGDIVFCDRTKLSGSKRRARMPDIVAVNEGFQLAVDESKSSDEPLEIDDMGLAEYFINVQPDRDYDFFNDPTPGMERYYDPKNRSPDTHFMLLDHISDLEERKKAKSRLQDMIERVADIWNQQWRGHIFTISMAGSMARFLRWDRGGTLITKAFDIRKEPGLLVDFLRLYYHSSSEVRGFITTVSWSEKGRSGGTGEKPEPEEGGYVRPGMVMHFVENRRTDTSDENK